MRTVFDKYISTGLDGVDRVDRWRKRCFSTFGDMVLNGLGRLVAAFLALLIFPFVFLEFLCGDRWDDE